MTTGADSDDHLDVISALGEPNRRALYAFVVRQGAWVSRDQAADGVGLQRGVAAHHLDRLAEEGLLEIDYQRLTGRSGPGAGRPAKVYRRARAEFDVALPPRDYELAGRLLADAIEECARTGVDVRQAVDRVARRQGRALGEAMRSRMGRRRSAQGIVDAALAVLADRGFEPDETGDGTVVLRNCPFHKLAQSHRELVCGMNHCLIDSALEELGASGVEARLEPEPDMCCVRLHRR